VSKVDETTQCAKIIVGIEPRQSGMKVKYVTTRPPMIYRGWRRRWCPRLTKPRSSQLRVGEQHLTSCSVFCEVDRQPHDEHASSLNDAGRRMSVAPALELQLQFCCHEYSRRCHPLRRQFVNSIKAIVVARSSSVM